jgi:arylsulfate sulfotransferase
MFVVVPTLTMDPNGVTPLGGVVEAETDVPTRATLTVKSSSGTWGVEFPAYETVHYIPVLGLQSDAGYTVSVTFIEQTGSGIKSPVFHAITPPLPLDFPGITVFVSQPEKMEPGYTLLDLFNGGSGASYSTIVDAQGTVVWYSTLGGQAMTRLPNGNLRWRSDSSIVESDLLGNQVPVIPLASDGTGLHHDLFETESGTFLSLSREDISVDDFPTSETDPEAPTATAQVTTDIVDEFASDGSLLASWSLQDIIDILRIGYGSLNQNPYDWSHSNAVLDDPSDDSIIVSVRHQDAVIKFSRSTGQLIWILGPHDNWGPAYQPFLLTPVGPLDWQYHEHAPMITPSGNLLLFDNGNFRASPFDGNTPSVSGPSRAVEFAIDENLMEVTQVWEYGMPPAVEFYSRAVGDADWLPETGNVLINAGKTTWVGGVTSSNLGLGPGHARITEVDHGTPAEVVFEMALFDVSAGLTLYRVERISGLYLYPQFEVTNVPALGTLQLSLTCVLIIAAAGVTLRARAA